MRDQLKKSLRKLKKERTSKRRNKMMLFYCRHRLFTHFSNVSMYFMELAFANTSITRYRITNSLFNVLNADRMLLMMIFKHFYLLICFRNITLEHSI